MRGLAKIICALLLIMFCMSLSRPYVTEVFNTVSSKQERKLPIYCVETQEKKISISFDAAWGADDTDDLLAILDAHGVKATFFLVGDWARKYPEEVKKIAAAGHDIGNHSNKHPHMGQLSLEENKKELMKVHEEIKKITGIEMNLFRPPFGEYNNTVMEAAQQCGYYVVQWDVDSLDWKEFGSDPLIKQVLGNKHLGNGSIVLFHNNAKYTKDALDTIITGLKQQGYELVPISQLILKENYYMDHEGRQKPIRDNKQAKN
ncbi:MAG: polysaccharide deacetylase family protein [Epulopiscium sp.]|nr:polysaccharide deacetylase family protein [Candidatus Epulonipiscium sp.]